MLKYRGYRDHPRGTISPCQVRKTFNLILQKAGGHATSGIAVGGIAGGHATSGIAAGGITIPHLIQYSVF